MNENKNTVQVEFDDVEKCANFILKTQGFLLLNDVYKLLGNVKEIRNGAI